MSTRFARLAVATVVVLALVGVTTGCCPLLQKAEEKAGEEIAEGIAEGVTGADDVEVNDDDMTITTDEGEVTISGGEGELPEDFPSDFPIPDATNTGSSSIKSGTEVSFYVNLETTDSVDDMKEFFTEGFADEGWTVTSESDSTYGEGRSVMMSVTKGKSEATLVITEEDGKTVMAVILVEKG